jgi:adenylyltransferase and sulfurtransferase
MNERMLMYDALQCTFMNIKKPKKQSTCPVCSANATIRSIEDSDKDLQSARGPSSCDMFTPSFLSPEYQLSCKDYQQKEADTPHILLDVRVKEQFDLCSLERAVNIPLEKLKENMDEVENLTEGWTKPVYCICRRGIFSVEATKLLTEYLTSKEVPKEATVKNIKGGLEAWRKHVDPTFPKY